MKIDGVWLKLLLAIGVIVIFIINATVVLAADKRLERKSNKTTETQIEVAEGGEPAKVLRRGKRYLDFTKGTRISWRTTVKNNILKVNTLWGYGFGFRANFPFPDKADRLRPFFKRDVFHALESVMDGHGFDGRGCLLKSFCTAVFDVDSKHKSGMLFKILKLVFSLNDEERRYFSYLRKENCAQLLHNHCPLSFNSISPYTDDV